MSATQTVAAILTTHADNLIDVAIANTPTQVRTATPALPMPAKPAGTPAPISRADTAPTIVKGQWVRYTSKAGKTSKYVVGWTGTCKYTGKPKVGLVHFATKKLFFVMADQVAADTASNPVRGRRSRQVATSNPATAKQWRFIGCLRKAVAAKRPDLANVRIADTTKAASAYIRAMLAACRQAGIKLSYGRKTGRMICCCGVPSCPIGPFTCPA